MKAINPTQIEYDRWSIPERVYRGGSWRIFTSYARASNRLSSGPSSRDLNLGFRDVLLGFRLVRNK
jgi:formylglycine-generating enzyme required for sulfatase activity